MESIVLFVMAHGTTVITMLLGAIIFCVFGLLLIGFHSPKDLVVGELGAVDRIEGVLRRILSEQQFIPARAGAGVGSGMGVGSGATLPDDQMALFRVQVESLEKEIIEKTQIIDSLEKGGATVGDNAELLTLKQKVKDLEEKLGEYAVIEEDIADLSKFRQENEDLRSKITSVTGVPANDAVIMPWDEFEKAVKEKKVTSAKDSVESTISAPDPEAPPVPVDAAVMDMPVIILSENKE